MGACQFRGVAHASAQRCTLTSCCCWLAACRYEVHSVLGKGSFGQVLKVLDYKTGQYKALKVIRNKRRFHHQAQVRARMLAV